MPKPWPFVETPAIAIERGAYSASKSAGAGGSGSAGVHACSTSRASAATAPSGPAMTGLHSSSAEIGAEAGGETVGAGDAEQDLHERVAVDRWSATDTAKHGRALEAVEHRLGIVGVDGNEARDDVVEDLGQCATESDRDHRAERRPAHHADEQLGRALDHLLDDPAEGLAVVGLQRRRDRVDGIPHQIALDADAYRSEVGLVHDPGSVGLDDRRTVERLGGLLDDAARVAAGAAAWARGRRSEERELRHRLGHDDRSASPGSGYAFARSQSRSTGLTAGG